MLPSHVGSCFWLGLAHDFCKMYMPKEDVMMSLITEDGQEYPVKYLVEKTGLSGGWRGFSILHRLMEGDVVVFQLIKATKFKVYIIRENELAEVDGALSLLGLDPRVEQTDSDKIIKTKKSRKKCMTTLPVVVHSKNHKSTSPPACGLELAFPIDQSRNDSEEMDSEIERLQTIVEFKDVEDLDGFTIIVNGSVIDGEIPQYVKTKYYELCCSQNTFLHERLSKVINSKLAAGIISETVNIADAIVASTPSTSENEFAIWDKSLIAFEQLGMKVRFLRSRLQRLVSLVYDSEQGMESKRYREALLGERRVEEEIKSMELKLLELRETARRFRKEIGCFKVKADRHEEEFRAEASAGW
ncbi:hypothetical protein ACHQM5_024031 [Ranunculus cassubicifolius]